MSTILSFLMDVIRNKSVRIAILSGLLLIAILVAFLRVLYFFDLETYWRSTVSDDAYYYAIGKSLAENGEIRSIVFEPSHNPQNAHIGIAFAYAGLYTIYNDAAGVIKYSGMYTLLLFVLALYFLRRIWKELQFSDFSYFLIVAYLIIHPLYFHLALTGRTEGFFYPLLIVWFYFVIMWRKNDFNIRSQYFYLLFFASLLCYSFRLQALIAFLALFLAILSQKKYVSAIASMLSSVFAYYGVIAINRILGGTGLGRGETSHLGNILDISYTRILEFIPVLGQLFFSYDRIPGLSILAFFILILIIGLLTFYAFKKQDFILFFITLFISGSLVSAILFRDSFLPGHLRYIAYVIPFIAIGILYVMKNESFFSQTIPNAVKLTGVLLITLISLITFRHTLVEWQVREYGVRDTYQRSAERFATIKKIHETYPEAKRYARTNTTSVETMRLLFAATDKPSYTQFDLTHISSNSLITLRDEEQLISQFIDNHQEAQLLYQFRINNHYKLYYVP